MASHPILILGTSGSGKSASIRNLNPIETFLINVCRKELPFRGGEKNYTEINKTSNPSGNKITSDNYDIINKLIQKINTDMKNVKSIVIDDSQYLIVNEFMSKHSTEGKGNEVFNLYNNIGDHFWNLLWTCKFLRDDLFIFFLHHSEINDSGVVQAKTIGKMLSEKVDICGMFTIVLFAIREGTNNYFYTQNDGSHPAKSPMGMFSDIKIDNDLQLVINNVLPYYKGE